MDWLKHFVIERLDIRFEVNGNYMAFKYYFPETRSLKVRIDDKNSIRYDWYSNGNTKCITYERCIKLYDRYNFNDNGEIFKLISYKIIVFPNDTAELKEIYTWDKPQN